jgi:hypothetical protein
MRSDNNHRDDQQHADSTAGVERTAHERRRARAPMTRSAELPDLMSVCDVAQWLRITEKAVRNMRDRGQLPAPVLRPNSRSLRWLRADLLEWWLAQTATRARRSAP